MFDLSLPRAQLDESYQSSPKSSRVSRVLQALLLVAVSSALSSTARSEESKPGKPVPPQIGRVIDQGKTQAFASHKQMALESEFRRNPAARKAMEDLIRKSRSLERDSPYGKVSNQRRSQIIQGLSKESTRDMPPGYYSEFDVKYKSYLQHERTIDS